MKKILVINDFPIFPIIDGGRVRLFNIYKNISKKFNVTYICLGDTNKIEEEVISENLKLIIIPKNFLYKLISTFLFILLRCPVNDFIALFLASYNPKLKKLIIKLSLENDIIIFSHPYLYPAAIPYISNNQIIVYEAHNVEYPLKKSMLGKGVIKSILLKRLNKIEGNLLKNCDLCFAMSEYDRIQLAHLYHINPSKIFLAPNGVNPDDYNEFFSQNNRLKESTQKSHLILFLGSGHPPNIIATQQIIQNIAPKVPYASFIIAGGVSSGLKNEYPGRNVTIMPFVSNNEKKKLYESTYIAINPMMSGSGTNIKMLDYMAAGIPVISTPIGARGIDIHNNQEGIICDIDEFPYQISRLIKDKILYNSISLNGRKLVKEKYEWKNIAYIMIEVLNNTLQQKFLIK